VRTLKLLTAASLALSAIACIPAQPQVTPEPRTGHVRVTSLHCNPDRDCDELTPGRVYEGPVVRLDSNRLDVFDLNSQTRFTVLTDQQALVEIYRGQRHGADVVTKGAARGALFGAASGLFAALVLKVAYGSDVDFGEATQGSVSTGVIAGGISGAAQAISRGDPAWERVSVRGLYEERLRAGARTP